MSFSEVTVLKFLGEKAAKVCDFIEASELAIGRFSLKNTKNRLKDLHFFLNDISKDWKDASMVYSSRYTDNDSVYGSQIKNMRKILETVEGLELKELTTNKCFVLLVKFNKKFSLSELVKLKRLKKISSQSSERRLYFNICEACLTWEKFNESGVLLIVSKTLGPTISDETILEIVGN